MKLKKIASLALAGVMAVSMLAGCKFDAASSSSSSSSSSETATDVTSKVAAILGKDSVAELKGNAAYDSVLSAALKAMTAAEKVDIADVRTATATGEALDSSYMENIVAELNKQLPNVVTANNYQSNKSFTGTANNASIFGASTAPSNMTWAIAYAIDGKVSENVAVNAAAAAMKAELSKTVLPEHFAQGGQSKSYDVAYTASVSMEKVTVDGESAWVAMVVISSDVTTNTASSL